VGGSRWTSLVLLAAVRALAVDGHAQRPQPRADEPRAAGGHLFIPSRLVTGPFTVTAFGTTTILGLADAEAPRYDLQGNEIGTRDRTLAAYGQQFNLDLRLTPDVSLRLEANGLVYSGYDDESFLTAGTTAAYGFQLGVTMGRTVGDARVALLLDVGLEPELNLLIANAVRRAMDEDVFSGEGLFEDTVRFRGSPGVSFAWGAHPALGLIAETRYEWIRRISDGESDVGRQSVTLAASAELDLDPLIRWPIGLLGAYRAFLPVSGSGDTVQQASAGLFYTRHVRLALGLEVTWRRGVLRREAAPRLDSDSVTAAFRTRFYW
jgi:hypothetical protein